MSLSLEPSPSLSRLVGRDEEISAVESFLSRVPGGAQGFLIEGEAGIGKTAVWRVAVERAEARGYRVLRCAGENAEARLSFVGLLDLIGTVAEEAAASLTPVQREALDAALFVRAASSGKPPHPHVVGMALRCVIVVAARDAPVVLAIDDTQWLDPETTRAVAFAARRLAGIPVGLVATVRSPLAELDVLGLERGLGSERYTRMRLGPMSLGAIRLLIEERLGYSYARPLLTRIERASEGNPLFALEIARALGQTPSSDPQGTLPVPQSLRELIAARVGALPPRVRDALLAASALARPNARLVEQISSAAGLVGAEEAGLVRVTGERIAFAHPLYAAAVYASAASGRRRELHRRLSSLVTDPEERARHRALATSGPDPAVADELEAAAELARSRGAWTAAGELLEHARVLTPADRLDTAHRLAVSAAEHHIHAGDRPRARALLEAVIRETPPGAARSRALYLLAGIEHHQQSFAEAARLLDEASQHAEPAIAIEIQLMLAYVHESYLIDHGASDRHAGNALTLAEQFGDPALLATALAGRIMVDYLNGRGIDWTGLDRSLTLEPASPFLPPSLRPSMIASLLEAYAGRIGQARERLTELRIASMGSGAQGDLAYITAWLVWVETMAGNLDRAASLADEADTDAVLTDSESTRAWILAFRALVGAQRGDVVSANADAAAATEIALRTRFATPLIWITEAQVLLALSLGDPGSAWTAAAAAVEKLEAEEFVREPLAAYFLPSALEAMIALGEIDRAEALLDRFEAIARDLDRIWALATCARVRGLLVAARGDEQAAEASFEHALREHRRIDMPFELARTLLAQGQVRRRYRRRHASREALEPALAIFERLGASLWAERTRDELARLGSRGPTDELTAAERRVAELAAKGCSNKEIAAILFISVHTVEAHLSHTYAKLGVRSRGRLAARMTGAD